jgi:hypothetical protein
MSITDHLPLKAVPFRFAMLPERYPYGPRSLARLRPNRIFSFVEVGLWRSESWHALPRAVHSSSQTLLPSSVARGPSRTL